MNSFENGKCAHTLISLCAVFHFTGNKFEKQTFPSLDSFLRLERDDAILLKYVSILSPSSTIPLKKNPKTLICLFTKQELLSSCVGSSGGSHRSRSRSQLWTNQVTAAWAHMFLQGVRGPISVSSSEWKILFQFRLILRGFLFFQRDRWHLCSKLLPIWKRQRQRDGWGGENRMVHTEMIF